MGFYLLRSVDLPKHKQMKIWATCLDFYEESREIQKKILNLSAKYGGDEYGYALFKVLTTGKSTKSIALKVPCDPRTLERARAEIYRKWYKY